MRSSPSSCPYASQPARIAACSTGQFGLWVCWDIRCLHVWQPQLLALEACISAHRARKPNGRDTEWSALMFTPSKKNLLPDSDVGSGEASLQG